MVTSLMLPMSALRCIEEEMMSVLKFEMSRSTSIPALIYALSRVAVGLSVAR